MLMAADPFVGTWKLNPGKSQFKTGAPPKDQTVTIAQEGSDLHIVIKGTASGGQPISSEYTVPAKGGAGKVIVGPWETVSEKRPSETQREVTYGKGGKAVFTARLRISLDGKSMTATVKGMDASGQTVDDTDVAEKQ